MTKARTEKSSSTANLGFEALIRPFRRRMDQNLSETRTLRDTLLSKLLSGEVQITQQRD